jgi:hypothetical protein
MENSAVVDVFNTQTALEEVVPDRVFVEQLPSEFLVPN